MTFQQIMAVIKILVTLMILTSFIWLILEKRIKVKKILIHIVSLTFCALMILEGITHKGLEAERGSDFQVERNSNTAE